VTTAGSLVTLREYEPVDADDVLGLDTSYQVESAVRVSRDATGFRLATVAEVPTRTKSFDLAPELVAASWALFEAWHTRQVLLHLYVTRSSRRQGVGRRLLDTVVAQARGQAATHVWLETSSANVPALTAYQRLGFEVCGLDLDLYDGTSDVAECGLFLSRRLA
jgi:GNAT superfamily N-acetyltransferase